MQRFVDWFENDAATIDPVLKAVVAHIWFVTVHPFDDGNGRIGRAIADLALARSEGTSQRFYSLSARLRVERGAYYETLESTQKGNLDLTARLAWFLAVLDRHWPMPRRRWRRRRAGAASGKGRTNCLSTSASG